MNKQGSPAHACDCKARHASREDAIVAIHRALRHPRFRPKPGCVLKPYLYAYCSHWHVGNSRQRKRAKGQRYA